MTNNNQETKTDEQKFEDMIKKGVEKLENMDCGDNKGHKCKKNHACSGAAGTFWFLGTIGAAIYYIQISTGFGETVLGLLKALVWPAFLVYNLFQYLGI